MLRQVFPHEPKKRIQTVLLRKEIKDELGDGFQAIHVIFGENRQVIYLRLDLYQLGSAHLLIGCRNRDHDSHEAILRRQRMWCLI